MKQLN